MLWRAKLGIYGLRSTGQDTERTATVGPRHLAGQTASWWAMAQGVVYRALTAQLQQRRPVSHGPVTSSIEQAGIRRIAATGAPVAWAQGR